VRIAWRLWVRVFKCLAQAHSNDDTGRCWELNPSIRNRRFWNIGLPHWSRVHICISKTNYHKVCLGENNTQGTSFPWVNKQDNYRIFSANSPPRKCLPVRLWSYARLGDSPKQRRYQLDQTPVAALLPVAGRPTVLTPVNKNFSRLLTLICFIRRWMSF